MKVELEYAKNPQFLEDGSIDLIIKVKHIPHEIPFTATPFDDMEYGREWHAMAKRGEFGRVLPHVAPNAMAVATRESPLRRKEEMDNAIKMVTHHDMMADPDATVKWKDYYRRLFLLNQDPSWPLVEWPERPEV